MKSMKTFFIWLLLSFIPLQGIAANAVLTCKAAHQEPVSSRLAVLDDTHARPCAGLVSSAHAPSQDDSDDNGQGDNAGCVAHYVSASWLHTAELALPSVVPLSSVVTFSAFYLPFVVPDGPERPPRTHFL